MTACLVPACERPKLALGIWEFLCLEHALAVVEATPTTSTKRPPLMDLRRRCWGEGLTCVTPAVTLTAHGGYCREHTPPQPAPTHRTSDPEAERIEQLAVLAVSNIGGRVESVRANLWAARAYGDSEGTQTALGRAYARSTPVLAETVTLADERVPRTARGMARNAKGWSVRIRAVDDPPSTVLRAWRGSLLVVARWENASFVSAWVQHSKSLPMALNARQAANLLKVAA